MGKKFDEDKRKEKQTAAAMTRMDDVSGALNMGWARVGRGRCTFKTDQPHSNEHVGKGALRRGGRLDRWGVGARVSRGG